MEESLSLSCRICLLNEGKSIRGQIDCCDHYFCFVCIMEWAKIESRCPVCKRRFTTIRRPPKEGVFPCERIVVVPKRDQIYHLFGNATIGTSDPYAHVQCSVCHATTDESLLLLCDLCDMASHTYCVGLGVTVPEGDWFCHDCTVLRDEHNNMEIDTETVSGGGSQSIADSGPEQNNAEIVTEIVSADSNQSIIENSGSEYNNSDVFRNSEVMPPAEANVSIFDIVHDASDHSIPLPRNYSILSWSSCTVVPRSEIIVMDNATLLGGRTDGSTAGSSMELNARTLQRCRNVHGHIEALRENWNALQNRSLSFSSISFKSGAKRHKRHNVSEVLHDRSGQLCSPLRSGRQLRTQDGSSEDSLDIEKAWKMMKTAKSMIQKSEKTSSVHQSSKNRSINVNASKQESNMSSSLHTVERPKSGNSDLRMENQCEYYSHQSETGNRRSLMSDCRDQITVMTIESSERLQSTDSTGVTESSLYGDVKTHCDLYNVNGAKHLGKNVCAASLSVADEQGSSFNLTRLVPGTSYSHSGEPDVCTSSSIKGNTLMESKSRKDDHAKSEIQSLVKLNLKLLSKDKRLGYSAFKKVARLATHTILAACGLEHPKSGSHFFPGSTVCSHHGHNQQLRKSTLMPNSCQECFYVFVKDVVHSIMFEKADHGRIC